jgi:tRNA uridine 5-carbamoylmethylation protein Kti12
VTVILRPEDRVAHDEAGQRTAIAEAWASCRRELRSALADPSTTEVVVMVGTPGAGKTTWSDAHDGPGVVVFDAVWANQARRRALALQIRAAGKLAVCVWVRTPLDECLRRQALRPVWRQVPGAVCHRAALALHTHPPNMGEGWSRLLLVDGTR